MDKRTDKRKMRQTDRRLVHFRLQMWYLVEVILTIFLIINWTNFVYLLVDPGFLSPSPLNLNFYEASCFVHP